MAAHTWQQSLRHCLVIFFVDNEPAQFGLMNGTSSSTGMRVFLGDFWECAASSQFIPWIDRVHTDSNCSDGISRGERPSVIAGMQVIWDRPILPSW